MYAIIISIHLMFLLIEGMTKDDAKAMDFNTSHVSINHGKQAVLSQRQVISIHLMFLLIAQITLVKPGRYHFNTSHVSINRRSSGSALR